MVKQGEESLCFLRSSWRVIKKFLVQASGNSILHQPRINCYFLR